MRSACIIDLDNTLTMQKTIRALGQHAGVLDEVDTVLARNHGEMPVTRHDTVHLAKAFAGADVQGLRDAAGAVALRPGAAEMLAALRGIGFELHLATNIYHPVAEVFRERLRLDSVFAPDVVVEGGRLTGEMAPPERPGPCGEFHCKGQVVHHFDEGDVTLAIGDGPNDLCMLDAATHAVGVEPCTSAVRVAADVVVRDLRAVATVVARRVPLRARLR